MRARIAAATLLVFLVAVAPAAAGDPILPLSQVHAGMRCTGYSVVRGTDIASFDVEVIDVVSGDPSEPEARILVRVSGAAVDATGVGPGFSGSPIYCDPGDGIPRNIGAISESVGDYGGKVVLATPIEAILATPVDPPAAQPVRGTRPHRSLLARAKPLAAPLVVSGVPSRLGALLASAGRKAGRLVLSAPAAPLASFPPQALRPGAAVSVGLSNGDLALGAIGTVAYSDGDRVWAFGHPLDGTGRRSLLLEDAYVFSVIGNPVVLPDLPGTYKLAAPGHDLGTLSSDGLSAVAGRLGSLPRVTPVHVIAIDQDTGARRTVTTSVADEARIGQPTGSSALSLIAPTAVAAAAGQVLNGSPARVSGSMCARIVLRGRPKPLRFCNRYVTGEPDVSGVGNSVAALAASDLLTALGMVDAYKVSDLDVQEVSVRVTLQRGLRQAFLRSIELPRRVRAGQHVRARVSLQVVHGPKITRVYPVHLPNSLRSGSRRLTFAGVDADSSADLGGDITLILDDEGGSSGSGSLGPASVDELADAIADLGRYDGVSLRRGDDSVRAFRDDDLRVSGRARTRVRVVRR
jgi:hypothetical protein